VPVQQERHGRRLLPVRAPPKPKGPSSSSYSSSSATGGRGGRSHGK
jgi:hypothetical protein